MRDYSELVEIKCGNCIHVHPFGEDDNVNFLDSGLCHKCSFIPKEMERNIATIVDLEMANCMEFEPTEEAIHEALKHAEPVEAEFRPHRYRPCYGCDGGYDEMDDPFI